MSKLLIFLSFCPNICHVLLLQKHLGKNENEKLDLHLCDLVIALIVIGIIVLTLYKATNHDFAEVSTESCSDGLIEASSNNICNFLNLNLFLLLTQTFFL